MFALVLGFAVAAGVWLGGCVGARAALLVLSVRPGIVARARGCCASRLGGIALRCAALSLWNRIDLCGCEDRQRESDGNCLYGLKYMVS